MCVVDCLGGDQQLQQLFQLDMATTTLFLFSAADLGWTDEDRPRLIDRKIGLAKDIHRRFERQRKAKEAAI